MELFQPDDNLELSKRAIISGSRQSTFNRRVFVSHPKKLLIKTAVEDWRTPPQPSFKTAVEDWMTPPQPSVKTAVEDWLEDSMTPPQPSVKMVVEDWMTPAQPSVNTAVQVWMLYMLNINIYILELALCQSVAQATVNNGDFGKMIEIQKRMAVQKKATYPLDTE